MPDDLRRVGVTGTREGATDAQLGRARQLLSAIREWSTYQPELHFGDCIGVDEEVHAIAKSLSYWTVSYPPVEARFRARCPADAEWVAKPYFERNRLIVRETSILLAFPKETEEAKRGGTWCTVRHAREVGRRVVIVWPDGTETP